MTTLAAAIDQHRARCQGTPNGCDICGRRRHPAADQPGPPLHVILGSITAAATRAARHGATIAQLELAARTGYLDAHTIPEHQP